MLGTITIVLLCLLIAVVAFGIITLRKALHRQTVALGQAYGNVNDLRDRLVDEFATQDKTLAMIRNGSASKDDLLEVVTAITTAFMNETIEIKAGLEAVVEALTADTHQSTNTPSAQPTGPICQAVGCNKEATVQVPYKKDILDKAEDVFLCDGHGQAVAAQMMKQAKPMGAAPKKAKVVCEDGYDHTDDPDYIPGQIHAHVDIPSREEFLAAEGTEDAPADEAVLKPAPLDDITAAIEAAYQAKKADINAALGSP